MRNALILTSVALIAVACGKSPSPGPGLPPLPPPNGQPVTQAPQYVAVPANPRLKPTPYELVNRYVKLDPKECARTINNTGRCNKLEGTECTFKVEGSHRMEKSFAITSTIKNGKVNLFANGDNNRFEKYGARVYLDDNCVYGPKNVEAAVEKALGDIALGEMTVKLVVDTRAPGALPSNMSERRLGKITSETRPVRMSIDECKSRYEAREDGTGSCFIQIGAQINALRDTVESAKEFKIKTERENVVAHVVFNGYAGYGFDLSFRDAETGERVGAKDAPSNTWSSAKKYIEQAIAQIPAEGLPMTEFGAIAP